MNVEIIYCAGCKWLIRGAWYAQELLQTFEQKGIRVSLQPELNEGGRFTILVNGEVLVDRKQHGGFPEIKLVKRMLRDRCWPEEGLSHTDRAAECKDGSCPPEQ